MSGIYGDHINSKLKSRTFLDFQGHFSDFSRTSERGIQGHFQDIWLKSNNIKEIPGPKLIKEADILTQCPYKVYHVYSLILFQIHMNFPESIINFPIDIPESAPKINVSTWLITFYWILIKYFPNIKHTWMHQKLFAYYQFSHATIFSHILYFKHLNPTLYRLLKEMSYKYIDLCHCQLLVSSTGIFIYTFNNKIWCHISKENFLRTP